MTQPTPSAANPANDNANDTPAGEQQRVADLANEFLSQDETPIESTADAPHDDAADYEEKLAEMKDQLIRALAETDNVRKRAQRDVAEANKYAITGFARNLVSVLENLQRATGAISDEMRANNGEVKNLAEGVEMTLRELLSVFEKSGIRRIEPLGEKFDHNFHQAMAQIEDGSVEPGTILQVLQAGYVIHDRLLQPALVNVSKRGEAPAHVDTEA